MESFDYIAYSCLEEDRGSVNTAEHYQYCSTLPFTSIKGDIRPTADGGVIMCHDPGFTLDENGRVTRFDKNNCKLISDMTVSECLALEHAEAYDGKHCKVTDFETYIRICEKSGKQPFITVRNEGIDILVPVVINILSKYNLLDSCTINSFTVSTLEAFRNVCPTIKLSHVLPLRKVLERSDVDEAIQLGNCILTTFHFTGADATGGYPIMDASADAITYAASKGVKIYQAQVLEAVDLNDLIRRGYSGAQMFFAPTF